MHWEQNVEFLNAKAGGTSSKVNVLTLDIMYLNTNKEAFITFPSLVYKTISVFKLQTTKAQDQQLISDFCHDKHMELLMVLHITVINTINWHLMTCFAHLYVYCSCWSLQTSFPGTV
jgi:hypothetical protein